MHYFKKIIRFALPYKKYGILNIISNVFYAFFSALSFVALIPMLDVLFIQKEDKEVLQEPIYTGILDVLSYGKDYMSWQIQEYAQDDASKALIIVITLVIVLFLLKNLFRYLAMYFITFLRNGVLKDLRNALYKKTVELPISF
ncbi:MAG: ABC transporter ATP-binding protein, partial [Flavobacteriaceae bacterium]|nr:ABC transporter ATP-binding protein [Flavobacteriaceae bacterium]